jgi:hypothetical protein
MRPRWRDGDTFFPSFRKESFSFASLDRKFMFTTHGLCENRLLINTQTGPCMATYALLRAQDDPFSFGRRQ